jgi:beta-glucanase (GH16 family)
MRNRGGLLTGLMLSLTGATAMTQPASTPAPPTGLTAPPQAWHLVWQDEFDGNTLDPAKWSNRLPFKGDDGTDRHHNPQYLSAVTDADVSVHDGMLTLTSRKVDVPGGRGRTYHYTEGFIHTDGKFRYLYGYAEARCRGTVGQGPGFWPAFWTLSDGWPPENDIVELWSSGHMHQGFAYRTAPTTSPSNGRPRSRVEWISQHTESCPEGWHTYGLEWGPGYEQFTFDGKPTNRITDEHVPAVPMYVMLNSGVSSDAEKAPTDASRWPMAFDVDWVRVWQKNGAPTTRP